MDKKKIMYGFTLKVTTMKEKTFSELVMSENCNKRSINKSIVVNNNE